MRKKEWETMRWHWKQKGRKEGIKNQYSCRWHWKRKERKEEGKRKGRTNTFVGDTGEKWSKEEKAIKERKNKRRTKWRKEEGTSKERKKGPYPVMGDIGNRKEEIKKEKQKEWKRKEYVFLCALQRGDMYLCMDFKGAICIFVWTLKGRYEWML